MKPTVFLWNQREFETFITRWAVPRDVDLQMLCEFAPFASFLACSWPLSCYSLERVCPEVSSVAHFSVAYPYAPHWCSVCPSALVHSCHMVSPFPPQTVSLCREFLCFDTLSYLSFRQSVCRSIQLAVFFVPSSAGKFGASSFLLREWQCLGAVYRDRQYAGFQGVFLCLQCFWYLSASINPILSNLFKIIPIIFLSFSPRVVPE